MTRNPTLAVFVLFSGFYLLTAGGHFYGQDGVTLYFMGKEILLSGSTHIHQTMNSPNGRWAKNGNFYSPFGPGQPVCALPLIYIGNIVAHNTRIQFLGPAVVSMFNPLIAALCLAVFFSICTRFYHKRKKSMILCFILGLSTPLWPYSKYFYTEPLITLCILGCFLNLLKFREKGFRGLSSLFAGIWFAWGVFSRPSTIFLFPGMLLYLYLAERSAGASTGLGTRLIHYIGLTAPVLAASAGYLFTNWERFGDPFAFGYTVDPTTGVPVGFRTPLLHGLYILLFSPGKSVFLFAPVCIAAIPCFYYFWRKHRPETFLIIVIFGITTTMYAKWIQPEGGYSWGPRFLVPCIPFLLIPAGEFIARGARSLLTYALVLLSLAGFIIQAGGVSVNFAAYISRHHNEYYSAKMKGYDPGFFPVTGHLRDTIEYIKALPEIFQAPGNYLSELRNDEIVNWAGRLDFWWMHFIAVGLSIRRIGILLAFNLLLFITGVMQVLKVLSDETIENRHIPQDSI